MSSKRKPESVLGPVRSTSRTLSVVLLPFVVVGLGSRCVSAHDHTAPKYPVTLLSSRADLAADDGSSRTDDESTCRLTLKLIDSVTKQPQAGLVRIKTSDGHVLPLEGLLNRGIGLRQKHKAKEWHVLLESAAVTVPRKQLTIEAVAGLETELTRKTVDLSEQAADEVTLPLVRFYNAASGGWHNGNTHLHLMSISREQANQYLRYVSRADELQLVFVSYLRRIKAERGYISNTYTKEDLQKLSWHDTTFGYAEEHRHNFGPGGEGYGHVMFLDIGKLIRPVSIGPGIMGEGTDSPSLRFAIDKAHDDGATVVWCHNAFGMQDVPEWLAGTLHAHNIFDGGTKGTYEDTYYRFMNIGLRVPFSTGTDWFMFDFSRVYVGVPQPLTIPRWLEALRAGRSFITNSPLLELQVDGCGSGDVIRLAQPKQLEIRGRAIGRCNFEKIEVVHNGNVVASKASSPVDAHFEAELTCPLQVDEPGWIALRVNSQQKNELGGSVFGHTSAVYVELAKKSIFKPEVAKELIADMRESIRTIEEKAVFADEQQRERVLNIYREGIATLSKRLTSR